MLKFKNKNSLLLVVFMLIGAIIFTACEADKGEQETPGVQEDQGTVEEATWKIVIKIPDGKSVDFINSDLEKMDKTNLKATTKKKDGTEEENELTGVKLKDVLKFAGIDGYSSVEIKSRDDFSEIYLKEMVKVMVPF